MFENVREDIRQAVTWHAVPLVRRWLGPRAEAAASIILSPEAQVVLIYRLQAWLRRRGIPLLPNLCRRLTMLLAGVSIGDRVEIGPGLLLNHGHVVIDGTTRIGPFCSIAPFVTIGLNTGGCLPRWADHRAVRLHRDGREDPRAGNGRRQRAHRRERGGHLGRAGERDGGGRAGAGHRA